MPITTSHIVPSAVRTITGVSTSVTAFIGRTKKGPTNKATFLHSWLEFGRIFGGLWNKSNMSYAVYHHFLNGGRDAVIVRIYKPSAGVESKVTFISDENNFKLEASDPGEWAKTMSVLVDDNVAKELKETKNDPTLFNLFVIDVESRLHI